MTDLTKINAPFGKLDDATKAALLLAEHQGEVIELYDDVLNSWQVTNPEWFVNSIYRVRPAPAAMGSVTMHGVPETYHPIDTAIADQFEEYKRLTFTFPTRDGLHVPGVYTSPDGLQIVIEVAQ